MAPQALTALFFQREPPVVVLLQGDQARRLPRQPSGSGARYAEAEQEFWVKGDEGLWRSEAGDPAERRCQRVGAAPERP